LLILNSEKSISDTLRDITRARGGKHPVCHPFTLLGSAIDHEQMFASTYFAEVFAQPILQLPNPDSLHTINVAPCGHIGNRSGRGGLAVLCGSVGCGWDRTVYSSDRISKSNGNIPSLGGLSQAGDKVTAYRISGIAAIGIVPEKPPKTLERGRNSGDFERGSIGLLKKARDEKTIVQAVYRNQAWVNVGVKGTISVLDDQQVIVRHADDVQSFLHFDLKIITSFKYGDRRDFWGFDSRKGINFGAFAELSGWKPRSFI
jgi:hypothetical protein